MCGRRGAAFLPPFLLAQPQLCGESEEKKPVNIRDGSDPGEGGRAGRPGGSSRSHPVILKGHSHSQARIKELGKTPRAPRRKLEPSLRVR